MKPRLRRFWLRALCAIGIHCWSKATRIKMTGPDQGGHYIWHCYRCQREKPRRCP